MKNDRQYYRKTLALTAYLLKEDDEQHPFTVRNLSLHGIMAHFDSPPPLAPDRAVRVRLPGLQLEGCMFPVWERPTLEGGLDVGFEFSSLLGFGGNQYFYRDDHLEAA